MTNTVPVTLELDPATAAALADPATRAWVETLIRRTVQPAGIGRQMHDLDLQQGSEDERKAAEELVERFRRFRAGKTLGGLNIKDLISEGRR